MGFKDFSCGLREKTESAAPYTVEFYEAAQRKLWERRGFYRRAFDEDSQNSIGRYLLQYSIEANEAALRKPLGVAALSRERAFEARHFAHGNVGCVIDWLRGGFEATPKQLALLIFVCMPDALRDAYEDRSAHR